MLFGNQLVKSTLKNALSGEKLDRIKEASRELRKQGFKVESVTQKLPLLNVYVDPSVRVMSSEIIPSEWIRDSLKNHRQVEHWEALRPVDHNGEFMPKGTQYGVAGYEMRHGEQTIYEGRVKAFGFTAVVTGQGPYKGSRHGVKVVKWTKGTLRNGNNPDEWTINYGRKGSDALWFYSTLEQTESVKIAAARMATQVNSTGAKARTVWFNVFDRFGNMFQVYADECFKDMIEAEGYTTRTTPNAATAGGEN